MTITLGWCGRSSSCASSSSPVIFGSQMSSSMTSKLWSLSLASAATPSLAVATENPASFSNWLMPSSAARSSSTSRMLCIDR
jgi:hypothetical protein